MESPRVSSTVAARYSAVLRRGVQAYERRLRLLLQLSRGVESVNTLKSALRGKDKKGASNQYGR